MDGVWHKLIYAENVWEQNELKWETSNLSLPNPKSNAIYRTNPTVKWTKFILHNACWAAFDIVGYEWFWVKKWRRGIFIEAIFEFCFHFERFSADRCEHSWHSTSSSTRTDFLATRSGPSMVFKESRQNSAIKPTKAHTENYLQSSYGWSFLIAEIERISRHEGAKAQTRKWVQ